MLSLPRPRFVGFLRQIILTASYIVKEKDAQSIGRGGPPSPLAIGNCSHEKDEKPTRDAVWAFQSEAIYPGSDLLSHAVAHAVPSALEGLTSVFGMGTGVSPPPWPPGIAEYESESLLLGGHCDLLPTPAGPTRILSLILANCFRPSTFRVINSSSFLYGRF